MTEAVLNGAKIGGKESAILDSCFDKVSLRGATFSMASITNTTFRNSIWDGVYIDGDSGFGDIDLTGASCDRSNLTDLPFAWGGTIVSPDGQPVSR